MRNVRPPLLALCDDLGLSTSQYDVGGGLGNVKQYGKYGWFQGVGMNIEPFSTFETFFDSIPQAIRKTIVTTWDESNHLKTKSTKASSHDGLKWKTPEVLERLRLRFQRCHADGGRLIFIGNGGSAAIASHMAVDYTKNAGIRAVAFNDVPTLTCLANDFGYENVFAKQLEYYATKKDVVVIVSSSGMSKNILSAAEYCTRNGIDLITFTGMNPNNELRHIGKLNFWVPSMDYGIVELTHLIYLHAIACVSSPGERWKLFVSGAQSMSMRKRRAAKKK